MNAAKAIRYDRKEVRLTTTPRRHVAPLDCRPGRMGVLTTGGDANGIALLQEAAADRDPERAQADDDPPLARRKAASEGRATRVRAGRGLAGNPSGRGCGNRNPLRRRRDRR